MFPGAAASPLLSGCSGENPEEVGMATDAGEGKGMVRSVFGLEGGTRGT